MTAPNQLDLQLAWKRVRQDHARRTFVVHPNEGRLVDGALEQWISEIDESLRNRTYSAAPCEIVEAPKGGGALRPGAILTLRDQVVYFALVGAMLERLAPVFTWRSPSPDTCYTLKGAERVDWIESRFRAWREFRERSLKVIRDGANYMVSTDVAGFYEHIDIRTLVSDLNQAGVSGELGGQLSRALSRWVRVRGRGVPQGYSASDLLAKVYLTRVDQALAEAGIRHLRYVDDFRIFCETLPQAKTSLMELQRLLRLRGLSLQSSKTLILRADDAIEEIDTISKTLIPVIDKYKHEVAALLGIDASYMTAHELHDALTDAGHSPPTEVLRAAYKTFFIDAGRKFDKSLFHYLLKRLGEAHDAFAAVHALTLLEEYPEETDHVLPYITAAQTVSSSDDALVSYLRSDDAVYPYQHYQVISWRTLQTDVPSEAFVTYVRQVHASGRSPSYLRSAARAFLGRFGSMADIDGLQEAYSSATSDLERAEIACALERQEKARRNGSLNEARGDGFLVARAVERLLNSQQVLDRLA